MEDKHPSEMTDEELDAVLGGESQEEAQQPPESSEEQPQEQEAPVEEDKQAPEPESEEKPAEEEQEEERQPSRRETLRIQNLLKKYGNPEDREYQPQPRQNIPTQSLNYSDELDADEEVIQRLQQDREQYGNTLYQQGQDAAKQYAEQQTNFIRWETSLKIENPKVEKEYPMLDKGSEEFHPAIADALNTMYLRQVGFDPRTRTVQNPNLSYADFVEANMELVEEIASINNQRTVQNIAKQTSHTGLRPDGGTAKRLDLNKPIEQMSDEELDAYGKNIGLNTIKHRI